VEFDSLIFHLYDLGMHTRSHDYCMAVRAFLLGYQVVFTLAQREPLVFSVEPKLIHNGAVSGCDELLPHVRCVGKRQPRPTIHLFDSDGDVGRQGVVNEVLPVIVSTEAVRDVGGETRVVVSVGIGGVLGQLRRGRKSDSDS